MLLLTGCAQKPWGDPLNEEVSENVKTKIEQLKRIQEKCVKQWDADLKINYRTALDEKRFEGYILVKDPSSFKFIASNPLGQPVLAITSDGKNFQSVDILRNQYTHGSTRSFAVHNNIPLDFLSGQWGLRLAAKLDRETAREAMIYTDSDPKNFWYVELEDSKVANSYLFDSTTLLMKQFLIHDKKGKILAAFSYQNYVANGRCFQPQAITIDKLSFGASIVLTFDGIQAVEQISPKDFHLTVPSHYFNRYLP